MEDVIRYAKSYPLRRKLSKLSAKENRDGLKEERDMFREEWASAINGGDGERARMLRSQYPGACLFDAGKLMPEVRGIINNFNVEPVPIYTTDTEKGAYSPFFDAVVLPKKIDSITEGCNCESCRVANGVDDDRKWARVVFHELSHATGHWSRLARITMAGVRSSGAAMPGSHDLTLSYKLEEVIAEWSAMKVMEHVGLMDTSSRIYMSKYAEGYLRMVPKAFLFTDHLRADADAAADYIIKGGVT